MQALLAPLKELAEYDHIRENIRKNCSQFIFEVL